MSLTVRYPDGMVITYNSANYLLRNGDSWQLFTSNDNGKWVASIQASAGAIVEATARCSVTHALQGDALRYVVEHLREFNSWSNRDLLRQLKQALNDFDARQKMWKAQP